MRTHSDLGFMGRLIATYYLHVSQAYMFQKPEYLRGTRSDPDFYIGENTILLHFKALCMYSLGLDHHKVNMERKSNLIFSSLTHEVVCVYTQNHLYYHCYTFYVYVYVVIRYLRVCI